MNQTRTCSLTTALSLGLIFALVVAGDANALVLLLLGVGGGLMCGVCILAERSARFES
jgi:hypothetical protein